MDELRRLSAVEIAAGVQTGRLDPAAVVRAHVEALDELAPLNALITGCGEEALARVEAGVAGPLAGVPLIVKDLFDTAGVRTTYGSPIYGDHVPDRTAIAVERLERAGAVTIAKSNLHEFAWGVTSQNPHFGFVQNPVRPGLVAGGSSGGNAAALAVGVGALSLGSDTGGSVRIPAACCQGVGFKPTLGKVPIDGCFALSPSFDTVGPMARTVADCALAHEVLTGEPMPAPRLDGLTVGVLEPTPEADRLESLGARLVAVTLPEPAVDLIAIFLAECAISHRHTYPARREEYGRDLQLKFDGAREVAAVDLFEAQEELPRWRERVAREVEVDLLVSPVLGMEIPPLDCFEPDVRLGLTSLTRPFNNLGWPAIAIGDLQIGGRDDRTVLAAALAWEQAYGSPLAGSAASSPPAAA